MEETSDTCKLKYLIQRSDMNEIEKIKIVSDLELNCILFQNDEVP